MYIIRIVHVYKLLISRLVDSLVEQQFGSFTHDNSTNNIDSSHTSE
jgi:hypothetical protein